jgi:hypothetical protein
MGSVLYADGGAKIGTKDHHVIGKLAEPGKSVRDCVSETGFDKSEDCKAKKGHADKTLLDLIEILYQVFHCVNLFNG